MAGLTGRQWGLVAVMASTPFVFAFLLAAAAPSLLRQVLGTALGGASWVLAALLGLLGGALFAAGLRMLSAPDGTGASRYPTLGLVCTSLVTVGLCIIPAFCLLLAGPALAVRLERGEVQAPREWSLSSPQSLAEQLRHRLPRKLPALPRVNPW